MMYEGNILIDVSGEEKKNLTVEHLLSLFTQASEMCIRDSFIAGPGDRHYEETL